MAVPNIHNQAPASAEVQLLETGLDTLTFEDQALGFDVVAANRELPTDRINTLGGGIWDIHGRRLDVSLQETSAGSRVFESPDGGIVFNLASIIDEMDEPAQNPSPDSIDSLYGWFTVADWGMVDTPALADEKGSDDAQYANRITPTRTVISNGFGEEPVPSLDAIQSRLMPPKKFYIEVHHPNPGNDPTINLTCKDYDWSETTRNLPLVRVDGLRWRTQQPLLAFEGPPYSAQQTESARTEGAGAGREEDDAGYPDVPGAIGVKFFDLAVELRDAYGRAFHGKTAASSYVAVGESPSAGVQGGQQVYYMQVLAHPSRMAQQMGTSMVVPLFDYPGIPSLARPNPRDDAPGVQAPTARAWISWGSRGPDGA